MKKQIIILGILTVILAVTAVVCYNIVKNTNKECTVSYDTSGGTKIDSDTISCNTIVTVKHTPEKAGYKFLGWSIDNKLIEGEIQIKEDVTLSAVWEKIKTGKLYTVTFDYQNGKDNKTIEVEENDTVEIPLNVAKKGYSFIGWYLNDKIYNFDTKITSDITLVAKWIKSSDIESGVLINEYGQKETLPPGITAKNKVLAYISEANKENICPKDYGYGCVNGTCSCFKYEKVDYSWGYKCNEGTLQGDKCVITENIAPTFENNCDKYKTQEDENNKIILDDYKSYKACYNQRHYTEPASGSCPANYNTYVDSSDNGKIKCQNINNPSEILNNYTYSCSNGTLTSKNNKMVCEFDIKTFIGYPDKVNIKCPSGYNYQDENTCIKTTIVDATKEKVCPSGYTNIEDKCTSNTSKSTTPTTKYSCVVGTLIGTKCYIEY